MDEKVLKWVAGAFGILTAAVCISLFYLPGLQNKYFWAGRADSQGEAALTAEREAEEENVQEIADAKALEPETQVSGETGKVETDGSVGEGAQLVIDIPDGIRSNEVTVENDYWNRMVYVKFPGAGEDYFSKYHVKGSSDGINEITYYQQGQDGVLAFAVDRIYGVTQECDQTELYLALEDPKEAYDAVVVVDAGHGGSMPGTVHEGIYEKDIDLAIVLELKKLFDHSNQNIGVFYTRLDDTNPALDDRVGLANSLQADLFISIHNNSVSKNGDTQLQGTQVLYRSKDDSELNSKHFAQICLDHVIEALGSRNVGLLKGDTVRIIGQSQVPVALIEVGFMSNKEELEKLSSQEYQARAAEGIYAAVLQAIEEGY